MNRTSILIMAVAFVVGTALGGEKLVLKTKRAPDSHRWRVQFEDSVRVSESHLFSMVDNDEMQLHAERNENSILRGRLAGAAWTLAGAAFAIVPQLQDNQSDEAMLPFIAVGGATAAFGFQQFVSRLFFPRRAASVAEARAAVERYNIQR